MNIPENDRAVFAALRFRADADSASYLAITGQRNEVVHRALTRGLESQAITFTAIINTYLIGLCRYSVYFSLSSEGRGRRTRVRDIIHESKLISWGAEVGGEYDFGVTIIAKSPTEAQSIIDDFNAQAGNIFQERAINIQLRMFLYPLKFFSPKASHDSPLEIAPGTQNVELSAFQYSLLKWLAYHGHPTIKDMTRGLGASNQEVSEALKYLQKTKVLACVGVVPKLEKFGLESHLLLVHTRNSHPEIRDCVRKFCANHTKIDRLIECLGAWEYEIGTCVTQEAEAAEIAQELTSAIGAERISHIQIIPLYQELMVTWLPASSLENGSKKHSENEATRTRSNP